MVVARVTYGDNTVIDIEQIYYLLQTVFSAETLPRDEVTKTRISILDVPLRNRLIKDCQRKLVTFIC